MIPGRGAKGETAGWAGNAKFAAGQGTQSEPYWPDLEGARCAHSGSQEGLIVKRSRRGGRRPQHGGNGGGGGGGSSNSGGGGGFNPNRTYDSSGPEVKIRGSASHVYEKYLQLARWRKSLVACLRCAMVLRKGRWAWSCRCGAAM